jgi:DNA mismatch endonuclease (patch repair protein)
MRKRIVKGLRDRLTTEERSALMAKVRGKGNRSTEMRVAAHLIRAGIRGWKRHPQLLGRPDFYFEQARVAIFVDGCFWHGCRRCARNVPRSRREFWVEKIEANRRRDRKVNRNLRAAGYAVLRVWEHSLSDLAWLSRLRGLLSAGRAHSGSD